SGRRGEERLRETRILRGTDLSPQVRGGNPRVGRTGGRRGGSGIRTRAGVAPLHALQACPFVRSGKPPRKRVVAGTDPGRRAGADGGGDRIRTCEGRTSP